jgi:beta-glucosidase
VSTAAISPEPPTTDLPFRDPARPLARRVDDLISRLTLDERIELLHQYSPGVPRLGLAPFKRKASAR